MASIIENINSIILTKSQLDSILNSQGVYGGDIFATYPEKFNEIFDSIDTVVNNILGE